MVYSIKMPATKNGFCHKFKENARAWYRGTILTHYVEKSEKLGHKKRPGITWPVEKITLFGFLQDHIDGDRTSNNGNFCQSCRTGIFNRYTVFISCGEHFFQYASPLL